MTANQIADKLDKLMVRLQNTAASAEILGSALDGKKQRRNSGRAYRIVELSELAQIEVRKIQRELDRDE